MTLSIDGRRGSDRMIEGEDGDDRLYGGPAHLPLTTRIERRETAGCAQD